jgi:hypothetical protein
MRHRAHLGGGEVVSLHADELPEHADQIDVLLGCAIARRAAQRLGRRLSELETISIAAASADVLRVANGAEGCPFAALDEWFDLEDAARGYAAGTGGWPW